MTCCGAGRRHGSGQSAKAAIAVSESGNRIGQFVAGEVGPQGLCEPQFGIGAFPQQEIRQALFAAGANEQVNVAITRSGGQGIRECISGKRAAPDRCGGGFQQGVAAGKIDCQACIEHAAASRNCFDCLDGSNSRAGQAIAASDDGEPDARIGERLRLHCHIVLDELHHAVDFRLWPLPVV